MANFRSNILIPVLMLHLSCGPSQGEKKQQAVVQPDMATWTQRATNSPNMQTEYAMAYHSFQKRIIAYGGRTGFPDFNIVNETWAFDYDKNIWTNLKPVNSPPWRSSHAMVYDKAHHKILMFGGSDFRQVFNDLWAYSYDQNTWIELSLDNPPDPRQMHGMVYVPDQDALILFGGRRLNGSASFNDLWKYSITTNEWQELHPANPPPVQDHVALTYDRANKKLIMYADIENNDPPATWSYDFDDNSWRKLNSQNTPVADHCKLVYDERNERSVMFAGRSTWMFDYAKNTWTDITPDEFPEIEFTSHSVIEHDGMVYLNDRNLFIQYGGCCANATLELVISK